MPAVLTASAQALAFPQDFVLELLVPTASKFDSVSYIKQAPDSHINSRDTLFFGM